MRKGLNFLTKFKKQQLKYSTTETYKAIRYYEHGNPKKQLKMETLNKETLKENEIEVKMLSSPINPADLNMVQGNYGNLPSLPAVGGNEGCGVVVKVGSQVSQFKLDDRVIPSRPGLGTWSTSIKGEACDFLKVSSNIPVEYSALLSVNPCTAYRMLNDFVELKPGDTIIQNGANSVVGQSVIQIAREMGLKTINIIRSREEESELIERLKNVGGDIVVTEDYSKSSYMTRLVSDLPKPKLALNCVGGDSCRTLLKSLDRDGVMVTYGGMSRKPVTVSTSQLIFNNVSLKGFWLTQWNKENSVEKRLEMLNYLSNLVEKKKLVLFSEVVKFSEFDEALALACSEKRSRKVVLDLTK